MKQQNVRERDEDAVSHDRLSAPWMRMGAFGISSLGDDLPLTSHFRRGSSLFLNHLQNIALSSATFFTVNLHL